MKTPFLIGIDGRSGAGKTTLAQHLHAHLHPHHDLTLLHLDDLYPGWNGLASGIDTYTRTILPPLRAGHTAHWRPWDWHNNRPGPSRHTPATSLVIIEGVGAGQAPELLDMTIWLEAPTEWRKKRALRRDAGTFAPYWECWQNQEETLLATYHPGPDATIHVTLNADNHGPGITPYPHLIDTITALCPLPAPPVQPPPSGAYIDSLPWSGDDAALFTSLYGQARHSIWLDTVGTSRGRYSVMADDSGTTARRVHYRAGVAEEHCPTHTVRAREPIVTWLRRQTPPTPATAPPHSPPAAPTTTAHHPPEDAPPAGWYGYLSYELHAETTPHKTATGPPQNPQHTPLLPEVLPEAEFLLPERMLILDHHTHRLHMWSRRALPHPDPWVEHVRQSVAHHNRDSPSHRPHPRHPKLSSHLRDTKDAYLRAIHRAQQEISDGNSYEVCLTTQVSIHPIEDPLATYRNIRARNQAPMGAWLRFGDRAILSTSPERLLQVLPDRRVRVSPIKGTRPRDPDPTIDDALAKDLLSAPKDRAENLMIVDLMRNDLSRCCLPGTIRVPHLFTIESYPRVHQLVSTIEGTLHPTMGAADALAAVFPAGSMTGAPKARTIEILNHLETGPRQVYSGAIGYLGFTGTADFSVPIRTLVVDGTHGTLGIGGAITANSDPEAEWEELRAKASGILDALGLTFPETRQSPRSYPQEREHPEA